MVSEGEKEAEEGQGEGRSGDSLGLRLSACYQKDLAGHKGNRTIHGR